MFWLDHHGNLCCTVNKISKYLVVIWCQFYFIHLRLTEQTIKVTGFSDNHRQYIKKVNSMWPKSAWISHYYGRPVSPKSTDDHIEKHQVQSFS